MLTPLSLCHASISLSLSLYPSLSLPAYSASLHLCMTNSANAIRQQTDNAGPGAEEKHQELFPSTSVQSNLGVSVST